MSDQFAWTFPAGKHEQEVTSVTLVDNTAKTNDITVPTGKRWLLQRIKVTNCDDVTRDITITLYKEAAKINVLCKLAFKADVAANAAEEMMWPSFRVDTMNFWYEAARPLILSAGNTIEVVWATGGASTGATDADGQVVDYLEIDVP